VICLVVFDSPVKYKGKKAEGYTLFGGYGDGNGGILKDYSMAVIMCCV